LIDGMHAKNRTRRLESVDSDRNRLIEVLLLTYAQSLQEKCSYRHNPSHLARQ